MAKILHKGGRKNCESLKNLHKCGRKKCKFERWHKVTL